MNKQLAKLKKELAALQKKPVTAPDTKKNNERKKQLAKTIAKLQIDKALLKDEINKAQEELNSKKNIQKGYQDTFEEKRGISKEHKNVVNAQRNNFSNEYGKELRDPKSAYDELSQQINNIRGEIQTGSLSSTEEKRRLVDLKKLEAKRTEVAKYLDSGAQNKVKEIAEVKETYKSHLDATNHAWEELQVARKQTDNAFEQNKQLISERDEIQNKIVELNKEKTEIPRRQKQQQREYEDWKKKVHGLRTSIRDLEHQIEQQKEEDIPVETENVQPKAKAKGKEGKAKKGGKDAKKEEKVDKRKQQEAQKAKEEEDKVAQEKQEQQEALEMRRKKAIAEFQKNSKSYERKKEEYESYVKNAEAENAGETPEETEQTESKEETPAKVDPNAAAKNICSELIDAIKGLAPKAETISEENTDGGRKRKKKKKKNNKKLRFTNDVVHKFAQVGVLCPKTTKDVNDTVSALEKKIESFDAKSASEE